jgi:uncharacterized protein (DUF58 family)
MSDLFDSEFLKKLQQLAITSKSVLTTVSVGNRKSRSKGSSIEFSDYREYTMGDDFRHIDWNAYGRFDKFFVKLFMEEREACVHIFLDTSKSMDWGRPKKSLVSRRLAAALSYISLSKYDMVSISCISSVSEKSKLSLRGRNSFGSVISFLEDVEYTGTTDLFKAVESSPLKSNRGISIIISDLLPPGGLDDTIKLLQFRKQEVHICHMLSIQEIDPEINTNLHLIDTETGEARDVAMSLQLLKAYRKAYCNYIKEIEETCLKRAVNYMHMSSDMALEEMLRSIADLG